MKILIPFSLSLISLFMFHEFWWLLMEVTWHLFIHKYLLNIWYAQGPVPGSTEATKTNYVYKRLPYKAKSCKLTCSAISATTHLKPDCYRWAEREYLHFFFFPVFFLQLIHLTLEIEPLKKLTVLLQPLFWNYLPGFVVSFPTWPSLFIARLKQCRSWMTAVCLPSMSTRQCLEKLFSGLFFIVLKSIFSCV